MKSRKTITHAELVSEVISATKTRGVLDPADIKKNIERYVNFSWACEAALTSIDWLKRNTWKGRMMSKTSTTIMHRGLSNAF